MWGQALVRLLLALAEQKSENPNASAVLLPQFIKPRLFENYLPQLPTLHCTVIGFGLDWESHRSLKHDRECLTELPERAFCQPHAIQRIQPSEVGWESDNKRFERKRGWVVCVSLGQPILYLSDAKTTTVAQISLFKLICSKNHGLIYLIVLPVG